MTLYLCHILSIIFNLNSLADITYITGEIITDTQDDRHGRWVSHGNFLAFVELGHSARCNLKLFTEFLLAHFLLCELDP